MAYSATYLYNWRRQQQNKRAAEQRKVERLNGEIDRLDRAYKTLKQLKNNEAKQLKNNTKAKKATDGYDWRGDNKNKFDNIFESTNQEQAKNFYNAIDDMMDEINMEIWRKKNQRSSSWGIIGACDSTIRYIGTLIANLTN